MFFQQAGYSLIRTIGFTFSFIGFGILIELAFRRIASSSFPSPSASSRIFNCKYAAVLLVFRGTFQLDL